MDYKSLRKINPEAARMAVVQYLSSNQNNVYRAAKFFSVTRKVIYDIISRQNQNELGDKSRRPKNIKNETPDETQELVVRLHSKHGFSARQIEAYLKQNGIVRLPYGTIRHILARQLKNH